MAHPFLCESKARRHDQRLYGRHARHRSQSFEIGSNENAMYAGHCLGARNIDPCNGSVRMWRAQDMAPQAGGTLDIVDVTATSREETMVFHAAN